MKINKCNFALTVGAFCGFLIMLTHEATHIITGSAFRLDTWKFDMLFTYLYLLMTAGFSYTIFENAPEEIEG